MLSSGLGLGLEICGLGPGHKLFKRGPHSKTGSSAGKSSCGL